MRIIFEKSLAVIVFLITYLHAAAVPLVGNMIQVPHGADNQLANFINSYNNNFFQAFSAPPQEQNFFDSAVSIDEFDLSIYAPRTSASLPNVVNSQNLLTAIRFAYNNINQFVCNQQNNVFRGYLLQNLQKVLSSLEYRYALAKIEDKVLNGSAFMGNNALNGIPNNFHNTIRLLTGRIFVVKAVTGIDPEIIGDSSAMIIPHTVAHDVLYDQIITCCHAMVADDAESPYLEFYFVRSENINPDTGLPHSYLIGNALSVGLAPQTLSQINTQNFIQYLRNQSKNHANNNEVRRITNFTPLNSCTSCLECHSPKYDSATDFGYGLLNSGFTFPLNTNFAPITIHQGIPAGNYNYYAIGYPAFDYYSTVGLDVLAQERNLSPFTITRSNSQLLNQQCLLVLSLVNGLIRHDATSSPGMSGGPLLTFMDNRIVVFGVISSSSMANEYACRF